MKNLVLGALAFAGGVIAEKKFNIAERILGMCVMSDPAPAELSENHAD